MSTWNFYDYGRSNGCLESGPTAGPAPPQTVTVSASVSETTYAVILAFAKKMGLDAQIVVERCFRDACEKNFIALPNAVARKPIYP